MLDVLLVNPGQAGIPIEMMPPLGLAYIATGLERAGYSVRILDLEVDDEGVGEAVSKYLPRIVGISGTTHSRYGSFDIARQVKQLSRDITTVYGGVHASFTAADTLSHVPEIDVVVRGEGEETMVSLARAITRDSTPLADVRGISFRGSDIVENPAAERITDLDALGEPALHLLNMNRYSVRLDFLNKPAFALVTSRGCTMRCSFCSASAMYGHQVTCHSPRYVVNQIRGLMDARGYEGIRFFDSTITLRRTHIEGICDEIERQGLSFPWECEIRVDTVDRPLLERMKRAGCYYVDFGVESASQSVLDRMHKGFAIERAQQVLDWCFELNLRTKVFFSFGHVTETAADIEETFRFIERNRRKFSTLACGSGVRVYPGTELEKYARSSGLLPEGFSWSGDYNDPRAADLSQDTRVPLLIQPQLGYKELGAVRLRVIGERMRGWAGFRRLLNRLAKPGSWRKLTAAIKLWLNRRPPH